MQPAKILGIHVAPTSYLHASTTICEWARAAHSKYVCVANVHSVMEAYDTPALRVAMNNADLVTPDGVPLVWALKLLGHRDATRVYGPDLTPAVLALAEREAIPVGFYGATPAVLARLLPEVSRRFPELQITYSYAPPFRPLTPDEDHETVNAINASGVKILFVGLGAPKQEQWMAEHKNRVGAVMLGVGAAFDFLAGTKPQAPRWMMRLGLEWLFRLLTEPRRLWKRYLKHNPRYVTLLTMQLLGLKTFGNDPEIGGSLPGFRP